MTRAGSPIAEITKARMREFYREPGALFWVFGFPVVMAVVLGLAFSSRPPAKPRVIVVETPHSHWLEQSLPLDKIDRQTLPLDEAQAARRFHNGLIP